MSTKPLSILIALVLVAIASRVDAQCEDGRCPLPGWQPSRVPAERANPAVCRVINTDRGGRNLGSGTLVTMPGAKTIVLTCAHLFRGNQSQVIVELPTLGQFRARVLAIDETNDLAALGLNRPVSTNVRVNCESPRGELVACGFGPDGRYACARGPVVGHATPRGATYPSLMIRGSVRQGDSGGGVFNRQGELVGVIWGVRAGITYATFGQPLRQLLERVGQSPTPAEPPRQSSPTPRQEPSRWPEFERRLANLEQRIARLPENLVTDDRLKCFATRQEVSQLANRNETRDTTLHERIEHVATTVVHKAMFTGAAGVGGPAAVVGLAALSWWWRGRQPRRPSQYRTAGQASSGTPIAVDTPPPPQQSVPETHYVPYQTDNFSRAYQWASEQVARKYPGAIETLTTLDSLIKQQVNAGT